MANQVERILKYECNDEELEVFIIQPGERLCIYGSCSLLCLGGNAKLNDYNLPAVSYEKKNLLKVSAPQRMDIPAILSVMESDANYKHTRIKFRLKEVTPSSYEAIMTNIGDTRPAVFVFNKQLKPCEEVIGSLISNFHIHSSKMKQAIRPPRYYCRRMDLFVYPEKSDNELKVKIESLKTIRKNGQRVSVLPIGHKGAGKSNLVRSIVNRCLSGGDDENVYVLDCDIGQSEFTPCGSLSLNKVTSPILDKPFGHQKANLKNTYFYGDITVNKLDLFLDIFERLWNIFCETSEPGSICIINTMGWLDGIGEKILLKIIEYAKPELFVEIYRDEAETRFNFPVSCGPRILRIVPNNIPNEPDIQLQKRLPAGLMRELSIIGYFSSLLPKPILSMLSEVEPHKLSFDNTIICLPTDLLVEDRQIVNAVNTQMVAICIRCSEIKPRRICNNNTLPNIAIIDSKTPALKCIGYGIIRGVSYVKREIYVLSPADLVALEEPPILVRGNRIFTPQQIYTANHFNPSPYVLNLNGKRNTEVVDDLYQPPNVTTGFKRSRKN